MRGTYAVSCSEVHSDSQPIHARRRRVIIGGMFWMALAYFSSVAFVTHALAHHFSVSSANLEIREFLSSSVSSGYPRRPACFVDVCVVDARREGHFARQMNRVPNTDIARPFRRIRRMSAAQIDDV